MSIFSKNKDKKNKANGKRNEIDNKELKEQLANSALSMFEQGVDYENLVNTQVEFGYLFDIDNHGLEALFKVITDINTHYFAVQKQSITRVNLSDEQFIAYKEKFLEMHG